MKHIGWFVCLKPRRRGREGREAGECGLKPYTRGPGGRGGEGGEAGECGLKPYTRGPGGRGGEGQEAGECGLKPYTRGPGAEGRGRAGSRGVWFEVLHQRAPPSSGHQSEHTVPITSPVTPCTLYR